MGTFSYPSFVCTVHKCSEVFHPAISVWILEKHAAHILPTKVHLMRQLQYCFHPNVAATEQSKLEGMLLKKRDIINFCLRKGVCSGFLFSISKIMSH